MSDRNRKRFEEWARRERGWVSPPFSGDTYISGEVQASWFAWQAASAPPVSEPGAVPFPMSEEELAEAMLPTLLDQLWEKTENPSWDSLDAARTLARIAIEALGRG